MTCAGRVNVRPAGRERWRRAARDAAPPLLALALSPVVAALASGPEEPIARMRRLIERERGLGLFFEPAVHRWFDARPRLMSTLRVTYVAAHLPVALGSLAWARHARPAAFGLARDTFAATQALAVVVYLAIPTAPPRMVPGLGYDERPGPGDQGIGRLAQSPYCAMPSAHTAFALVAAGTVFTQARSPLARAAALLYPPAVVLEILATGDHIWLDALGGAATAAAGAAVARTLHRRPQR